MILEHLRIYNRMGSYTPQCRLGLKCQGTQNKNLLGHHASPGYVYPPPQVPSSCVLGDENYSGLRLKLLEEYSGCGHMTLHDTNEQLCAIESIPFIGIPAFRHYDF
jgi:hypothetical protein